MVAAIWTFMPGQPALAENRPGIADQFQTGHTVPSASSVPFCPAICAGCGMQPARTPPISGRSRSQRLDTVGWLTPKTAPATSRVRFLRISAATIATGRYSSIAGRPAAPPRDIRGGDRNTRGQLAQLPARQPGDTSVALLKSCDLGLPS
jgi:hypothetical protein